MFHRRNDIKSKPYAEFLMFAFIMVQVRDTEEKIAVECYAIAAKSLKNIAFLISAVKFEQKCGDIFFHLN